MTPINIQLSSSSGSGDWLVPALLIWGVIWLFALATVLYRSDFDPVTKLTWVVVVIFVPFFGVLLYWAVGPNNPQNSPREFSKSSDSTNQLSGTPWENDPGYTERRQQMRQRRSNT